MSSWFAVVLASALVFSWKFFGYLVPKKFLESRFLFRLAGYLTVALLAGLVGVQTFVSPASGSGSQSLAFDARLPALVLAAVLLKLKVPFLMVVISAAATAALVRLAF